MPRSREELVEALRLELAALGWDDASARHHENYEPAAAAIRADLTAGLRVVMPAIEAGLLERLKERVKADLVGESADLADLAGPLGEAIAEESGSYSLEFCEPETVAAGFCNWLAALQNGTDVEETDRG